MALYGGDLAEGLGHDCFAAERERLADRYEDALANVAAQRLAAGDVDGAREAAERLIARDPLREEAHEVLIAVHGLIGSRSQVVRQYRASAEVLARELAERPLPETDATLSARSGPDRRTFATARECHGTAGTDPEPGRRRLAAARDADPRPRARSIKPCNAPF